MNSRLRPCTMWQEVEKSTAQRRNRTTALLKRLFADCRERLPEGCRGRPMAISDVVELNHGAKRAYYYVSGQDQFRQVKFSPMLAKKEIPEKT